MQTGSKTNATIAGINTNLIHWSIIVSVSSNNDFDVCNNALESLVESFLVKLDLKESLVHIFHEKDRLGTFPNNQAQDSFTLHTDNGYTINDEQSTVHEERLSPQMRSLHNLERNKIAINLLASSR